MTLTNSQIKEFQKIHKKVFGTKISSKQAMAHGLALIKLVSAVQPIKEVSK